MIENVGKEVNPCEIGGFRSDTFWLSGDDCLKDNMKEWTDKLSNIMAEHERFRVALKFIAKFGGTVQESELGDIDCNGKWAANQAMAALPFKDCLEIHSKE